MLDMKAAAGRLIRSLSFRDSDTGNVTKEQKKLTKRRPQSSLDTEKINQGYAGNEQPALRGGESDLESQEESFKPATGKSAEDIRKHDKPDTPEMGITPQLNSLLDDDMSMNAIKEAKDIPRELLPSSRYDARMPDHLPFFCPLCPPGACVVSHFQRLHEYAPSFSDSDPLTGDEPAFEPEPATNQYSWTNLGAEETLEVAPSILSVHSSSPSLNALPQFRTNPFGSTNTNRNNYPGYWYTPTRLFRASSDPLPVSSHCLQQHHLQQQAHSRRHSENPAPQLPRLETCRKNSLRETLRRRASSAASDVAVQARGLGRWVVEGIAKGFTRKSDMQGEQRPVRVVIRRRRGGMRWAIESEDDGVGSMSIADALLRD
jgi:hypothetical protein